MPAPPLKMSPGVVYLDAAIGSREFGPILEKRGQKHAIVPRLPADFALLGRGPDDKPVRIGVERKTLSDLGSSLLTNRFFGTQLPRMWEEYDRFWLVVEGIWRCGKGDTIEVMGWDPRTRKNGWVVSRVPLSWSQLQGWLLTYDEAAKWKGKRWRTSTDYETGEWLSTLCSWWNKPYHRHAGHIAIDLDNPMPDKAHALIHKPNRVQKTAFSLDRLGAKTALKVGRKFRSIRGMVNATQDEWRAAGLGKKDAESVWWYVREEI